MSLFDTLSKYTRDEKEYWLKELYLNHILESLNAKVIGAIAIGLTERN